MEELTDALASADATRAPARRDLVVATVAERAGDGRTELGPQWVARLAGLLLV
ncbi:hypothetical protein [Streptomyces tendae]|uniref:hypothetical protein n=1 Tax=Streptomyces tendae TaxID=1932 RepID=UPI003712E65C